MVPYSHFPQESLPDLPRYALHDKDDLAARVRRNAHDLDVSHRVPTEDDAAVIAEILGGRVTTSYDVNAEALERSAVVLCLNEDGTRARERLYVGMSCATDLLVVVGDPAVVRAVGGHEVAKRLGVPVS